ncbi:MAG: DUF2868 domain-containing protein [Gammaproteobacteria bacterium]
MNTHLAPRLSDFETRWLAEALRLHEQASGPLADAEAVAAARRAGGDVEQRILARARGLGVLTGLSEALVAWRSRSRLLLVVLAVLALASGFGAALGVLGSGGRPVNVVWAVGALLGVHLVSLLLWSFSLALGGRETGGALGHAWLWLSARLTAGAAPVAAARLALLGRAGLARGWLGAVTHGLWLLALTGALAGLLVALAARRYDFVWETTILPAEVFVRLVQGLGWLPAQFGFAVPEAEAIRASGLRPEDAARIAWSSWLVGCVVIYGCVPRLLLWLACLGVYRSGCRRLRLDLSLPGYALLVERLAPASERLGISDPAPAATYHASVGTAPAVTGHAAVLVGVELRPDLPWPPLPLPVGARDAGVIDSREQRSRTLAELAAAPPARLLIACDPRLSPDRGSLELIAELARRAGACRVWLVAAPAGDAAERRAHWREGLQTIGLAPAAVIEDATQALDWLGRGDV